MSIRKIVLGTIENLRQQIAIWDDPNASSEAKGRVLSVLVGNDPHFWSEVAKRAIIRPASTAPMTKEEIVREVEKMETVAEPLVSKQTTMVLSSATSPAPATAPARTLASVPTPASTTAPARKITESDGGLKTWVGFLTGAIKGSNIPWKTAQNLTTKLFLGGVKLTQEQWTLFFAALKAADEKGNHLLDTKAKPATIFASAPVELVDDLLFGRDGILPSVTGEVADCDGKMENWLCAKCSIVLDAVEAVDIGKEIGKQEEKLVEKFLNAIDQANGPDWLIEKGKMIWSGPQVPVGSTSRPLAVLANIN